LQEWQAEREGDKGLSFWCFFRKDSVSGQKGTFKVFLGIVDVPRFPLYYGKIPQ
jgi:hypothetical protein